MTMKKEKVLVSVRDIVRHKDECEERYLKGEPQTPEEEIEGMLWNNLRCAFGSLVI
jgi:hypothetical protein